MKNTKAKVALVIALAAVLITVSISAPTFSWFARPQNTKGDALAFDDSEVAYDGEGVSMVTYSTSNDGKSFDASDITASLSGQFTDLAVGDRNYYLTDITNNSSVDQNVSLYISNLEIPNSTNGRLCLGVNGPTRIYKNYSNLGVQKDDTVMPKTDATTVRIYFQIKDGMDDSWHDKQFYACVGEGTAPNTYYGPFTFIKDNTYYLDIPSTTTQLYISQQDWTESYQHTQTFTDVKGDGLSQLNSLLFYLENEYANGNVAQAKKQVVNGACFKSYYSGITIAAGEKADASLKVNEDYIGDNIKYYSDNESVFKVDENKGVITAVGAGEAYLYSKSTGQSYGDYNEMKTKVTVSAVSKNTVTVTSAPIVTNLLIKPGVTEHVYWYIRNDESGTGALTYKMDGIYIGL